MADGKKMTVFGKIMAAVMAAGYSTSGTCGLIYALDPSKTQVAVTGAIAGGLVGLIGHLFHIFKDEQLPEELRTGTQGFLLKKTEK